MPGPGGGTAAERDGRVVLVAGGAGGIGAATARRFAAQVAHLFLADQDGPGLARAATSLEGSGARVATHAADLRTPAACRAAVEACLREAGRLDVLVNAAGVWREGPSEETAEADFDLVLDVNLKAPFFLAAAAIPHLAASRGCVVNVASDAGLVGNAGAAAYCASKGGLVLATRALALELAPRGVRVNAVCPGDVDTPMIAFQADRYGGGDPRGYLSRLLSRYPQGASARFVRAEEVAELIFYLASPAAAPVTGAALSIDFGITAGT
jgi:NAD(P)-dependent dehydrogenase (short-subunit alcohol dehydrogenase family)